MPIGTGGEFTGGGGGASGGGGGAVSSVNAADGSVTISPTTGAVGVSRAALTGDVTATAGSNATSLVGTTNVENIIRANTLDQLTAPAAAVSFTGTNGAEKLTGLSPAITAAGAPTVGQLNDNSYAHVVSGCVWTADATGSTLLCSMTAGTVMIGRILLTVAAVTSRAFTANVETYIDLKDNGDGTAAITYTTVPNNTISPALAGSGTLLNTCRIAIISSGASSLVTAGIGQGAPSSPTLSLAGFSTTVAAGSNGNAINTTTLTLASGSGVPTGGGWAQVAHASGQTYTVAFTGVSGAVLQGVTVISGTVTGTVATGDTVKGLIPLGVTDLLGNLVYPTRADPILIGYGQLVGTFVINLTTISPIAGLIAPFIVPPGPARPVRITVNLTSITSSGAAGTSLTIFGGPGNAGGFSLAGTVSFVGKVSVASDGWPMSGSGIVNPVAAGASTAQVGAIQSAAGLTIGNGFTACNVMVELV